MEPNIYFHLGFNGTYYEKLKNYDMKIMKNEKKMKDFQLKFFIKTICNDMCHQYDVIEGKNNRKCNIDLIEL